MLINCEIIIVVYTPTQSVELVYSGYNQLARDQIVQWNMSIVVICLVCGVYL